MSYKFTGKTSTGEVVEWDMLENHVMKFNENGDLLVCLGNKVIEVVLKLAL